MEEESSSRKPCPQSVNVILDALVRPHPQRARRDHSLRFAPRLRPSPLWVRPQGVPGPGGSRGRVGWGLQEPPRKMVVGAALEEV